MLSRGAATPGAPRSSHPRDSQCPPCRMGRLCAPSPQCAVFEGRPSPPRVLGWDPTLLPVGVGVPESGEVLVPADGPSSLLRLSSSTPSLSCTVQESQGVSRSRFPPRGAGGRAQRDSGPTLQSGHSWNLPNTCAPRPCLSGHVTAPWQLRGAVPFSHLAKGADVSEGPREVSRWAQGTQQPGAGFLNCHGHPRAGLVPLPAGDPLWGLQLILGAEDLVGSLLLASERSR